MHHKIENIYLDLDGVVADFNRRYIELFQMDPKHAEKKSKFDDYFRQFIAGENFATLPMMPNAMELINYLKSLPIPTTSENTFSCKLAPKKIVSYSINGLTDDLIVTGWHSVLVDEYTNEQLLKMKQFNVPEKIVDGKKLLIAATSPVVEPSAGPPHKPFLLQLPHVSDCTVS